MMSPPYEQAMGYSTAILSEYGFMMEELLPFAKAMKEQDLKSFHPSFVSKMYVEVLFHGNIKRKEATKIVTSIKTHFIQDSQPIESIPN